MKLTRKIDKALVFLNISFWAFFFGCFILGNIHPTYADGENNPTVMGEMKYVSIYDNGKKQTFKTTAGTVAEVLARANVVLSESDLVEPNLDTVVDVDNFYINIYRARPVVVRDGTTEKYLMLASADPKTIAAAAGLIIYDNDEIKLVANNNFLEAGAVMTYQVIRNGGQSVTIEDEIPFGEERIKDYNLKPGITEVRQLGEVGIMKRVYQVFYVDGKEVKKELVSEEITREPVRRIVAVGASAIEKKPLTAAMGRNRYTVTLADGRVVERQETYYDLPMSGVMKFCGGGNYIVRADGVKVDKDGYVLVAADLNRYPRCSVVETSLGLGKVYDTGTFALENPEQFDLATDWTKRDGR